MSSKTWKTTFKPAWLVDPSLLEWVEQVPNDPFSAKCTLCKTVISLSNMGKQALRSHMKGTKHMKSITMLKSTPSLTGYFKQSATIPQATKPVTSEVPILAEVTHFSASSYNAGVFLNVNTEVTETVSPGINSIEITDPGLETQMHHSTFHKQCGIQAFVLRDKITRTEILFCLQVVMTHKSLRTAEKDAKFLQCLCPDSEIAKKIQLSREKISYTLNYGIAPFFKKQLLDVLQKCDHIVLGFDESLNKVSQKQQMDIFVRFWDDRCDEVSTSELCILRPYYSKRSPEWIFRSVFRCEHEKTTASIYGCT